MYYPTHWLNSYRPLVLAAVGLVLLVGCEAPQPAAPASNATPSASTEATSRPATVATPNEKELLAQAARYERLRKPQPLPAPQPQPQPAAANPPTAVVAHPPAAVVAASPDQSPAPAKPAALRRIPAPQPRVLSRDELTEKLAGLLNTDLARSSAVRPYIQRAALSVIDPREELTREDLACLSHTDQQMVLNYQRLFLRLGRELGQPGNADRQLLIDAADTLADQIGRTESLSIRTVRLCKRVRGYGVYDELPSHTFLVGREYPLIVYAELEHFLSKVNEKGDHVVKLSQELVLYNASDGLAVWRQAPVAVIDTSRNRRRDFFLVQIIRLSDRLTVGKYQLKLSITDEQAQQVDEATVPIQIVADPKLVGAGR